MDNKEIQRRKENFEGWLFSMSDVLEEFVENFSLKTGHTLDYSVLSLIAFEEYILDNFSEIEELKKEDNKYKYDAFARYLGETIRKNIGGKWKLDIDNEKSAYFKLPILVEDVEKPTPICPHRLVTACIVRKKGTFLFKILDNLAKKKEVA